MGIPKILIIDVDGVMTTGQFIYSKKGKEYKIFGPHDTDGLDLLKKKIKIIFVTADKKGLSISKKRIEIDLGYKLFLVSHHDRYKFIKRYGVNKVIYIGDGYYDAPILKDVLFGIAPKNARIEAKRKANFITKSNSGKGAILDAAIKINSKFFLKSNA
jgi:3-deoxy-D-manno-octulosonate 8-phosphate phosphatase (KDO 8-P phosphatase)|tara:strand:- start:21 stop:494 length:474 start_codon:yes stop_codon:yes gene_type:complete